MQNISAKPVQLDLHKDTCISFRADSFVVSFGDAKKFYEEDGKGADRYIDWLNEKILLDPLAVVHIWQENEIVGQIELRSYLKDSSCGYVNLYYLIPSKRGAGIGKFLDQYMIEYYKKAEINKVQLSVSPTNFQAVSYYKKMGWIDLGPREGHSEVHLMEKKINQ
jgi:ribosomal protein S18 acetylase RimI-like enzyme